MKFGYKVCPVPKIITVRYLYPTPLNQNNPIKQNHILWAGDSQIGIMELLASLFTEHLLTFRKKAPLGAISIFSAILPE